MKKRIFLLACGLFIFGATGCFAADSNDASFYDEEHCPYHAQNNYGAASQQDAAPQYGYHYPHRHGHHYYAPRHANYDHHGYGQSAANQNNANNEVRPYYPCGCGRHYYD